MSNLREMPTVEHLIKRIKQNKHSTYTYPLAYYKRLEQQIKQHELRDKSLDMRRRILKINEYQTTKMNMIK